MCAGVCLLPVGCSQRDGKLNKDAPDESRADGASPDGEKKPDFSITRVTLAPSDEQSYLYSIKPGHWLAATQQLRANNFDFVGHLETAVVDDKQQPIFLKNTRFRLAGTRPVALAKGQKKHVESTFFVPHTRETTRVSSVLRGRHGQIEVDLSPDLFNPMPPYQYYFLVVCNEPERYAYLNVLDSIRAPAQDLYPESTIIYYQIVRPEVQQRFPLPSHSLVWSPIAYMLWDDVQPTVLTDPQQVALVDWLHWGGQLLISGPDSLESLNGSFLQPYLPASSTGARTYSANDLRDLTATWSQNHDGERGDVRVSSAWSGIGLQLTGGGAWVGRTGKLLAERRVGRGRIVVSAVQLAERDLINWSGYDAFFNACLLRRPARRYMTKPNEGQLLLTWARAPQARFDSRRVTQLRYFSRDAGRPGDGNPREARETQSLVGRRDAPADNSATDWTALGGMASWNPFSDVANAARQALRNAAGIVIPRRDFVWRVLLVYLIVLVPVNWALFRGLKRVEWAWIAAPVIAVGFALAVIRLAQLDIGFARSQIEIAVLEAHAGYPRAHITRYNALYSALTTDYEVQCDDLSAVARPLPIDDRMSLLRGQRRLTVTYRRHKDVRLSDLRVDSNTTGMVHSEQMLDLKGAITMRTDAAGQRLLNGTFLRFEEAFVLARRPVENRKPKWSLCRLDSLSPGASVPLVFEPASELAILGLRFADPSTASDAAPLRLDGLLQIAARARESEVGQEWFIGRSETPLPGLRIEPQASQVRSTTFAVVHLEASLLRQPRPDWNSRPASNTDSFSRGTAIEPDPAMATSTP